MHRKVGGLLMLVRDLLAEEARLDGQAEGSSVIGGYLESYEGVQGMMKHEDAIRMDLRKQRRLSIATTCY